jgi:hypothetical protein
MRASITTLLLGLSSAIVAANCGGTDSQNGASGTTSESPLTSLQPPNGPSSGSSGSAVGNNGGSGGGTVPEAGLVPYISENCSPIAGGGATDCDCGPGGAAISGGAFSGSATDWLNASQAGPSYGASPQTWRVSCVDSASGNRTQCGGAFAVCVPLVAGFYRISTQCKTSASVSDCTCYNEETAVSGGAYASGVSNALNASQSGPSYGASPQTWRTACADPRGNRVACTDPFAVCVSAGRFETETPTAGSTPCLQQSDLSWDCGCPNNLQAVSGGAFGGLLTGRINASQAGPLVNFGTQWWHMSCTDRAGAAVSCVQPFAVCGPF